jgi:hypothetical protein
LRNADRQPDTATVPDSSEQNRELLWSGQLGSKAAFLQRIGAGKYLTIGDWRTEVRQETVIRHHGGLVRQRLRISSPGEPDYVYSYRLPWSVVILRLSDPAYDHFCAEDDDPGLVLTDLLGGTSDWMSAAKASTARDYSNGPDAQRF